MAARAPDVRADGMGAELPAPRRAGIGRRAAS
jgi:hypothetical protein